MRTFLKPGLLGLLAAFAAGAAFGAEVAPRRTVIMPLKIELPAIPVVFSKPSFPTRAVEWDAKGRGAMGSPPRYFGSYLGCGGRFSMSIASRETRLVLPLASLGEAYLKCRAMRVSQLAPIVRVSDYPAGWFGDWVQDGVMVRTREDVFDEDRMRALFTLLTECVAAPQDDGGDWLDETALEESLAAYRETAQFSSEWTIEFIGGSPLRVELDARDHRLLVEAGDDWDTYELDATRARQLTELLAMK